MPEKVISPNLRILIIDDNPEIHKDFIKILTKEISTNNKLNEFENKIFGETNLTQDVLPEFEIDTASQGQEGNELVKKAIKENI